MWCGLVCSLFQPDSRVSCRYLAELPLSSNWNPTTPGIYTLEVNSDSYDNIAERLAKITEINNFSNQRAIWAKRWMWYNYSCYHLRRMKKFPKMARLPKGFIPEYTTLQQTVIGHSCACALLQKKRETQYFKYHVNKEQWVNRFLMEKKNTPSLTILDCILMLKKNWKWSLRISGLTYVNNRAEKSTILINHHICKTMLRTNFLD